MVKTNRKIILKNDFKINKNLKGGKMPTYEQLGLQKIKGQYDEIIGLGENFKGYFDDSWDKLTIPDKKFLQYFESVISRTGRNRREALDFFAKFKAYINLGYKNINRFLNCKILDVDELKGEKSIIYSNSSNVAKKIKDFELKNIYYDGSYVKNQYFENKLLSDEIYRNYIGADLNVFKTIYLPLANYSNQQFQRGLETLLSKVKIVLTPEIKISDTQLDNYLEQCKYNVSSLLHWNSFNPLDQAILSPDLFADGIFEILNHENTTDDDTQKRINSSISKMSGYLLEDSYIEKSSLNTGNYNISELNQLYTFDFYLCKPDMYYSESPSNKIFDINWYSYDSFGFMKFIAYTGENSAIIAASNNQVYQDPIALPALGYIDNKPLFSLSSRITDTATINDERRKRGLLFLVNNIGEGENQFYDPIQNTSFAFDTIIKADDYARSMQSIANGSGTTGAKGTGTQPQANNEWAQKRSLRRFDFSGSTYVPISQPVQTSIISRTPSYGQPYGQSYGQPYGQQQGQYGQYGQYGQQRTSGGSKQKGGYITSDTSANDKSNDLYQTGNITFTFNGTENNILENKNNEFLANIYKIQEELLNKTKIQKIENLNNFKLLAAIHVNELTNIDIKNNINKLTSYFKLFSYFDFISKLFNCYLTNYINYIEKKVIRGEPAYKKRLEDKIQKLKQFKEFNFLLGKKIPNETINKQQEKYATINTNWNLINTIRPVNNLLFYFNIDLSQSVFLTQEEKGRYLIAVNKCRDEIKKINSQTDQTQSDFGIYKFEEYARTITNTYEIVFQKALDFLRKNNLRLLEGSPINWVDINMTDDKKTTFSMGNPYNIKKNIMKLIITFEQIYREKVDGDFSLSGVNLFMSEDKYITVINGILLWFIHERGSLYKLNKELNVKYDRTLLSNEIKAKIPQTELQSIIETLKKYFYILDKQNLKFADKELFNKFSQTLFQQIDLYVFTYFKNRFERYTELKDSIYKVNKMLSNSLNCEKEDIPESLRENIEELLRVYGGKNSIISQSFSEYHQCKNLLEIIANQWKKLSSKFIPLFVKIEGQSQEIVNEKRKYIYTIYSPIIYTELINRINLLTKFGSKLDQVEDIDTPKSKTGFILYDAETDLEFKTIFDKLNINNKQFYPAIYQNLQKRLFYNPKIYESEFWDNLIKYYDSKKIKNIWYPLVINVDKANRYSGSYRYFLVNLLKWAKYGEIKNACILEKKDKKNWIYVKHYNNTNVYNGLSYLDDFELIELLEPDYVKKIPEYPSIIQNLQYTLSTQQQQQQPTSVNKILCFDDKLNLDFNNLLIGLDFYIKDKVNEVYKYFQYSPRENMNISSSSRIYEIKEFVYKILFNYSSIEEETRNKLNYSNGFILLSNISPQNKKYEETVKQITTFMTYKLYTQKGIMMARNKINLGIILGRDIFNNSYGNAESSKYLKLLYYENISKLSENIRIENIL
jgi:hypothetical protein